MKRTLLGTAALFVCVLAANMFTATTSAQGGDSRIQRGFEVAPVPLNMKGLNPALVGLGSYIVNAQGGCNDCHTNPSYAPGGDPFAGGAEVVNSRIVYSLAERPSCRLRSSRATSRHVPRMEGLRA